MNLLFSDHEYTNESHEEREWNMDYEEGNNHENTEHDHSETDEDNTDEESDDDSYDNVESDSNNEQENSDDGEPEPDPNLGEDLPLYEGAPITTGGSLACILTFALRFSLTGVALEALLKLIFIHCPAPNFCKKSLYLFKKHFAPITVPLRRKYYCSVCYNNLETQDSVCENCPPTDPPANNDPAYFVEIPLLDQL